MFTRLHGTDVLCCPKFLEFEMKHTCSCVEDVRCVACMTGAVDPAPGAPTPPADDVRVVSADVVLAALAHVYDGLADRASLPAVRMSNAKLRLRRLTDRIDQQAFEFRPRGTVTDTEAQALAWSAGYEAGAEDQANVEGHRYTPDNTSWMVVTPNPHRGTEVRP